MSNKTYSEYTGIEKGAILMIALGPEKSSSVFRYLKDEEIEELTSSCEQYAVVSLGKRIMRAETAALAACSVIMYERGFV